MGTLIQKTRELLMKRGEPAGEDLRAKDTAPGVRQLKQIWDIDTKKKREPAPAAVAHDIYRMPARRGASPPRLPNGLAG